MKVLSLVSQKGGSSKSTLVRNCAVSAMREHQRTLIVDLDPQKTSEQWYQQREAEEPLLVCVQASELTEALQRAEQGNFDWVIIDTAGRDTPAENAAIRVSDFCLIPCRPTADDLRAIPPTVRAVKRLQKNAGFVLTQSPPVRSTRAMEAMGALDLLGFSFAPVMVGYRMVYQDSNAAGLGVAEFEPRGKAAGEIRRLWQWIKRQAA